MFPSFPIRGARLCVCTLVLLPALSIAQESGQRPDPLDPAHPVPQSNYVSVFDRYQSLKDDQETPEKRWVKVTRDLMPREKATAAPVGEAAPAAAHAHGGH